jgi:hypothetical protein
MMFVSSFVWCTSLNQKRSNINKEQGSCVLDFETRRELAGFRYAGTRIKRHELPVESGASTQ